MCGYANRVLVGMLAIASAIDRHFCHAGTSSVGSALWDVVAAKRTDA
jgi:hypothetical protein